MGALSIAGALHIVDENLLCWWLAERQCDSGGLNGRPEKQAYVCYSWWIISAMNILGRTSWIDQEKLVRFVLQCQDVADGGIADQPGNMADIFHTFFGISALSLLGYLQKDSSDRQDASSSSDASPTSSSSLCLHPTIRPIDPTYALPRDLVLLHSLNAQTLPAV